MSFFAFLKGVDSAGIEKEFAPCVRLTTLGTRAIMMTPFHHMLAYMEAKKVPIHDFSIKQVRDYFMGITSERLEDYKIMGAFPHDFAKLQYAVRPSRLPLCRARQPPRHELRSQAHCVQQFQGQR